MGIVPCFVIFSSVRSEFKNMTPKTATKEPKAKSAGEKKVKKNVDKAGKPEKAPKAEKKEKVPKAEKVVKKETEPKSEEKKPKVAKKEKPVATKKPVAKTVKAKGKAVKPAAVTKEAPKKSTLKFYIDCKAPIEDGIMQMTDFATFVQDRFKINGKKGPNPALTVEVVKNRLAVSTVDSHFSKKYLKYLVKKYMKKNNLRDWLRVVTPNNAKDTYELRYFNINNDDDAEEEADE